MTDTQNIAVKTLVSKYTVHDRHDKHMESVSSDPKYGVYQFVLLICYQIIYILSTDLKLSP